MKYVEKISIMVSNIERLINQNNIKKDIEIKEENI
jgi:hypothetical protein